MIVARYLHVSLELWGGIFCLIAAFSAHIVRKKENLSERKMVQLLFCVAFLLFCDAGAWLYRGTSTAIGYYLVRFSNLMVFELEYTISMIFTSYLVDYLEEEGEINHNWCRAVYILGGIGMFLLVVSQFTGLYYYFDAENFYHRASMYWLCLLIGFVETVIYGGMFLWYRKRLGRKEQILFGSYICIPALSLPIQYLFYGISLVNIAVMMEVILMFIHFMMKRSLHLAEQERKMSEMQIQLVLSQVQPHFMYNCLNSIYYLCEQDPQKAQMATNWFADYLRNNMDSMRRHTPVPFERELKILDNYLNLEKMRFEEDLQTKFEINAINFMIPSMTLQPIVENAIKHGLRPKLEGGTVKISSKEQETYFEIIVSDDGVGYEPEKNAEDGRSHTGIENVRKRLWFMCRGTLEISGSKGEGTTVVIHIPKEKKKHGDYCSR